MRLETLSCSLLVAAVLVLTFHLTRGQVAGNQTTTSAPLSDASGANSSMPEIAAGENPVINETETAQNETAFNPCANALCANGGACIANGSLARGYLCQCIAGWMGENCTQSK